MKRKRGRPRKEKIKKIITHRVLEEEIADYGYGCKSYYEEKETCNVRGNVGIVLPRDAVFSGIGIDIQKYLHHNEVANLYYKR